MRERDANTHRSLWKCRILMRVIQNGIPNLINFNVSEATSSEIISSEIQDFSNRMLFLHDSRVPQIFFPASRNLISFGKSRFASQSSRSGNTLIIRNGRKCRAIASRPRSRDRVLDSDAALELNWMRFSSRASFHGAGSCRHWDAFCLFSPFCSIGVDS